MGDCSVIDGSTQCCDEDRFPHSLSLILLYVVYWLMHVLLVVFFLCFVCAAFFFFIVFFFLNLVLKSSNYTVWPFFGLFRE